MPDYSIIIPCYRSGPWLEELVRRIGQTMSPAGHSFELLLVNDASPDDTWTVIERLACEFPFVRGFDLQFNTGQYRATICGLEHAVGEFIVTMDDDLQHQPEDIPTLINALKQSPQLDCVMAKFPRKHQNWLRNLGSGFASWLFSILYGKPRNVFPSSFRVLRRGLAEAMYRHQTVNPAISPLLYRSTTRIGNVTIDHHPRESGRSGYTLFALIRIVVNNYFSASTAPLRLVSILGFCSAIGSIALGCYYLNKYLSNGIGVAGFTTLVLLLVFFGGLTLFAIGLVGEYLIRIMDEVRRPPRYSIRSTVEGSASSGDGTSEDKSGSEPRSTVSTVE